MALGFGLNLYSKTSGFGLPGLISMIKALHVRVSFVLASLIDVFCAANTSGSFGVAGSIDPEAYSSYSWVIATVAPGPGLVFGPRPILSATAVVSVSCKPRKRMKCGKARPSGSAKRLRRWRTDPVPFAEEGLCCRWGGWWVLPAASSAS